MRFLRALLLSILAITPLALAQEPPTTSITGNSIMGGSMSLTGTICVKAVDRYGNPISITKSGGGFYAKNYPFCQTLTAGAITSAIIVPNADNDSAAGHGYDLTIYDTASGIMTDVGVIYGIGGTTWSLDTFEPPSSVPTSAAFTYSSGTGAHPTTCVAPSLDSRVNAGAYTLGVCGTDGTFHDFSLGANPPGSETRWFASAICNGGVAYSASLSTLDNNQPPPGCVAAATSSAAWMAFQASPVSPQYALGTFSPPAFWTGSDLVLLFASDATTTGNVNWIVEASCVNANGVLASISYSSPITLTTTVSSVTSGLALSTTISNFVTPGTAGCSSSTDLIAFRIHRGTGDTATGDAHLLGVTVTSRRSQ